MSIKFYTDILEKAQEYQIGDVLYIVESRFCPFPNPEQKSIRDRVERLLIGDFADLTIFEPPNTMEAENVCSVAQKGELNATEEK